MMHGQQNVIEPHNLHFHTNLERLALKAHFSMCVCSELVTREPRVLSTRRRTQEYRPEYLNQPPIQYTQRGVRQYTDTQTPNKLTQSLNIQAFTN